MSILEVLKKEMIQIRNKSQGSAQGVITKVFLGNLKIPYLKIEKQKQITTLT